MCLPPHPQQQQFNKFYSENVKIKKQSVLTRNLLVTIRTLCMKVKTYFDTKCTRH